MANTKRKSITRMNSQELEAETARFDQEMAIDETRAMNASQAQRWELAKRKRGRPRTGDGAKVISVSVERRLLAAADSLAAKRGVTRARLVAEGLTTVIAKASRKSGK